jgi:hypothetical protein
MNIPEKVRVGCIDYDVEKTSNTLCLNNRKCSGIIHYEDAKIELDINRNIQNIEETFLHETVHAIAKDRGLDWGDNDELYTDEIAKGLYSLIRDNPDMFK